MVFVFEFKDKNHGFVAAVLQQDVESVFPVRRRASRNFPEFESNFQGGIFQKGFWEGELNKETSACLLLGVIRKRDHARLRRLMREKHGEIERLEFKDDDALKEFLLVRPELARQWFLEK
jgi:hypothetical protein